MKKYQVVFRDLEKKINQSDYPADSFPAKGSWLGSMGSVVIPSAKPLAY